MNLQIRAKGVIYDTLSGTTSLRIVKASENAEAAIIAAANKQARIEEADTFRGVHLDPNAHHWDEVCNCS